MNVLIATDGSDDALDAATTAFPLLAAADTVTVVCVVETPGIATEELGSGFGGGAENPAEIDRAWATENAAAAAAIDRTIAALPTSAKIEPAVEFGDAGQAISRLAEERGSDVVVVGSRGHGALRRALLGSVSTHVVNHAPCAVMIVRRGASA
jgi:nucleotide-binding universal stress UspA family protein